MIVKGNKANTGVVYVYVYIYCGKKYYYFLKLLGLGDTAMGPNIETTHES